jgi:hypothetical protein
MLKMGNALILKLRALTRWAASRWAILAIMAACMVLAYLATGTSCFLYSTVGLPCPGCGTTRALGALLRGDVAYAHRMHPLALPAVALIAALAARAFLRAGGAGAAAGSATGTEANAAGKGEAAARGPAAEMGSVAAAGSGISAPGLVSGKGEAAAQHIEAGGGTPGAAQKMGADKGAPSAMQKAARGMKSLSAFDCAMLGFLALYVAVYAARMLRMFPNEPPMEINQGALCQRLYKAARALAQ